MIFEGERCVLSVLCCYINPRVHSIASWIPMWGNGASFVTFWFKIQNNHSGRYLRHKKRNRLFWMHCSGYFFFGSLLGATFTPITCGVLKAVFEGELEGHYWFEIRVLRGLMPVLGPQERACAPRHPKWSASPRSSTLDWISVGSSITN